jgi:hypothetical protein
MTAATANFETTLSNGFPCDAYTRLECLAEMSAGIKGVTEVQTIGDEVFGIDSRTVFERRQAAARQLRLLAKMAIELADEFDAAE